MGFAVVAALLMVSVLFQPFVQVALENAPSSAKEPATDLPKSESAPPLTGSTDSPGGISPPPGRVNAVYIPPTPEVSTLLPSVAAPRLTASDLEYRYSTSVGEYVIPRALPFLLRYESHEGDVLVTASTFTVKAPGVTSFVDPVVLRAGDDAYQVRYDLRKASRLVGNVTLTYLFAANRPPKITADLQQSSGAPLALTWVALTVDTVVSNGKSSLDFSSAGVPTRAPIDGTRASIGPGPDRANWPRRVTFDWTDAGAGTAFVGRGSIGRLTGSALLVEFPDRMPTVDPTIVGSSGTALGTNYPIQRKVFQFGDRYWAFWYDGSNIVYSTSRNAVDWSAPVSTGSGTIGLSAGFDVDHKRDTVLVAWVPEALTSLRVLAGLMFGGLIRWYGSYTPSSWSLAGAGPVSAIIGTDEYFWVSVIRWETTTQTYYYVYRSTVPTGGTFTLSYSGAVSNAPMDSIARLLALPNGGVFLLVATRGASFISSLTYGSPGWYRSAGYTVSQDTVVLPRYHMSAAATPPATPGGPWQVILVYRHSSHGLAYAWINPYDSSYIYAVIDSRDATEPTVSIDADGDPHIFWNSAYHIYYNRWLPSWKFFNQATEPFAFSGYGRYGLSAIPAASAQVAVIWTEYPSSYQVMFAALSTPMDWGSQTGDPWNRQGLSPYQTYFHQMSEYVSPGSGLLTVKQTDLSLPGRGLNLDVTRIYTTPRAFMTAGGSPAPYLYEAYDAALLGAGWAWNFPWISSQYIHLWDGQMYVFDWTGETVLENHDGEHFVVKYLSRPNCDPSCQVFVLYTKSGTTYEFDTAGRLRYIKDLSGNKITFNYSYATLDNIVDTLGRKVQFATLNGVPSSVSTGSQTVTYGYQTVNGVSVLASVTDSLGRATRFDHTDARTPYLLTGITYPTGGKDTYAWSNPAVPVGPDLYSYYVTRQEALNAAGQSIRANQVSYQVVNGKVSYVSAVTYDAGVEKGCTVQLFDSRAHKSVSIRKSAPCAQPGTGTQLAKEVMWFDPAGGVGQVDVYPGASTSPAYSTYTSYDDWGNLIYSRDAIGHERFASFVNTRSQGGFVAPGRLTRTVSGLLFFDDFEDRDLSDWIVDTTAGTVGLDYSANFASVPPVLKVAHTGGASGVAAATHTFAAQSGYFIFEAYVRPEETNRQHYVLLRTSTSAVRAYVSFRDNGYVSWYSGSAWTDLTPYQAKQWYRIAFEVTASATPFTITVNDLSYNANLVGSGSIDRINFQASCSGCGAATMYVDMAEVYQSDGVTVQGLRSGQIVALEDSSGQFEPVRVGSGSTSATVYPWPLSFPYYTVKVYDSEGFLIYSSPVHDFWGGDTWTFTQPWKSFPSRTRTGFLRNSYVYVEDGLPSGAAPHGDEVFDWCSCGPWIYDGFPVSGSSSHKSTYVTGTHQHYFDSATSRLGTSSGDYHIQYVALIADEYPSELMLQFHDTNGGGWDHRAYWGANLIDWGTDGTPSRFHVGDVSGPPTRWLMFIVRADDVATPGKSIDGLAYTLYGGFAVWDYSVRGDLETGEIHISGLQPYWKAALYYPNGTLITNADVPAPPATEAYLRVYTAATPKVTVFPIDAYFVISNPSNVPIYRSPVMSFWGGDVYNYAATNFYPNADIDTSIHDRVAGIRENQTGLGAPTPGYQETYVRYTPKGLPDRTKVREDLPGNPPTTVWRETSYGYDPTYGTLTSVTDPKGNYVTYLYSPTYSKAYVTQVGDGAGVRQYAYDPTTGWRLAELDGRGYMTRYAYDLLGRRTDESRYDRPPSSEVLYFDMDWTTEETPPHMVDLSAHGNMGTISGTTPAAGRVGMARAFDGSGDYVEAPDSGSLDINGNQLTIAAWVYPQSPNFNTILDKEASYEIAINNNIFQAAVETSAPGSMMWGGSQAVPSVPTYRWTHVAFVYESGTTWKFYINGVLRETIAPANGQTGNIVPSNYALHVGDRAPFDADPFIGLIDEVRVFNTALNATNIGDLFSDGYGRLTSMRVAYDDVGSVATLYEPTSRPALFHYDMETLLNGKMEDLAGNGNEGTISGPTSAPGKFGGSARHYAANADTISAPGPSLSLGYTVAAWYNPDSVTGTTKSMRLVEKLSTSGYEIWLNVDNVAPQVVVLHGDTGPTTQVAITLPSTTFAAGVWTHTAVTWDGFTVTAFVNGVNRGTASLTKSIVNAGTLKVGGFPSGGTSGIAAGSLDEVLMYDRVLTASELSAVAQGTLSGFYQKSYFDSLGRMTRAFRRDVFASLTSWETYGYNFQDQIVTKTLARNSTASFTTTYAYDFLGRPTSVTYPGNGPPLTVSYNDVSRIRTVVSENGRKMQYLCDVAGRTVAVREYYDTWSYYTTSYAYDEVGNLLSVTNALSQVTQHQYDNLNRLTKTTYPDTTKYEKYSYDEVGNLHNKTDRSGQVTTYVYESNLRYRLQSIDYSSTLANPDVTYAYDPSNNPTTVSKPTASQTVGYVYDGLNRVKTETDTISGVSYVVGNAYDPAGRVTQVTYPDNAVISYVYDNIGRTGQVKDATVTYGSFAYNADHLTKNLVLGNQINQSYAYNGRGWPTSIKATYGQTTYLDLGYSYDNSGNVLTMGSSSFTYDKLDRLLTASGGFGSHTYTYDAIGDRVKLHYGGGSNGNVILRPDGNGSTTQWGKSGSGGANWDRVDEATADGDSTYVYTSTNGYKDLYSIANLTQSGTINSVTVTAVARGVWNRFCDPDCYGGLKLRVNNYSGTAQFVHYLAYDTVSQTWTTNPANGQQWTPSDINALQAGMEKVSGGAPQTRVTQLYVTVNIGSDATYVYTNGPTGMNQLTSMTDSTGAMTSFGYDANGNQRSRKGASWLCYAWGPEGLLSSVTSIAMSSTSCDNPTSPQPVQAYVYDGMGRRLNVTSPTTWTVSIFAGQDVVYEKSHVDGQADQITKYVYANGMRIAKITSSGAVQYYLGDHLGSTRKVLDASRNSLFSTDYEPFGKPYGPSGSEAYKFTSEKHDDPTGLVYLRARQYDPEIGRFVSADPVLGGLADPQSQNRYVYVTNNPARFVDPTGREIFGAIAGAIIGAVVGGVICAAQNNWQWSDSCWRAVAVGALAGAIGGLTFNPSASMGVWAAFGMTVAVGAATGAASSAVAYTANYALTPGAQWSWNDFGGEVAMGAVIGAVSAGAAAGLSRLAARSSSPFIRRLFGATQLELNELQGDAGQVAGARWLRAFGEDVREHPPGVRTPFGIRFHDAAVIDPATGKVLYYAEFKTGGSAYLVDQRIKDMWINMEYGIPTFVIRFLP